jgi:hypothetical protein
VRNLCLLITILLYASCTKQVGKDASYISYHGSDGKQSVFTGNLLSGSGKGVRCTRMPVPNSPGFSYFFQGHNGSIYHSIILTLRADSLSPGKYSNANGIVGAFLEQDSKQYFSWASATKPFVVTISRHSNGSVSGTFEGKLYVVSTINPQPTDSIAVTGKMNDVYVKYE